ncbi:FMN-binding negative transcriptional regulator [Bradyrhizobium sp. CCGUVB1N3]|uniref:FMN-binding negative transcriptional regulator n=1 Tax=Bradyrhizobium sp. CCGUVB1N3 TaxID=2949629 RepID=UPI002114201D|nr:FMN-binding negative transcriptional regulator [Bradyrhizobium sp. CCGUVB1N3]
MLLRQCWAMSTEETLDFIDLDPWALLVCNGKETPLVTAIPLLLDRSRGKLGTLVGHIARANPQASAINNGLRVLTLFQGPRAYVSPSWYPARDMAPTMYHVMVEAEGDISLQDQGTARRWIDLLTRRYETGRSEQWTMGELPEDGIARRMTMIVGFEVAITTLRGKAKLGQDEPRNDALSVASKLDASGMRGDQRLAAWIRKKNP